MLECQDIPQLQVNSELLDFSILLTSGQQRSTPASFTGSAAETEDPEDGKAEAQAALRAAKRARKNGSQTDGALFATMEAAEQKHEAKKGDNVVS